MPAMSNYALALSPAEIGRYRMMAEVARDQEAAQWEAAGIRPGAKVADVGCGPAAVTVAMAELVGSSGSVVGVDGDAGAVAAAGEMIAAAGVGNATVRQGRADETGLEPGAFDVVVMRHVLAHNGGHEQRIVDHLASLSRPGGSVYLVDVEMTAMRMTSLEPDLQDMMDRYVPFHLSRGNDPQIGLRLGELLRAAGLEVVDFRGCYTIMSPPAGIRPPIWAAREAMVASGHATAADLARWEAAFERVDAAPERPTLFAPMFSATGRRREMA
jgi:precorrin-6B methylase 2